MVVTAEASPVRDPHYCRFCASRLHDFIDLGMSPLCESFLTRDRLDRMEPFYPLAAELCPECFLVQLPAYVTPDEIFTEYAYFSGYSDAWLQHARTYVADITARLALSRQSHVVELASNDGYLLQYFVKAGIPVLGIDPAANVARAAEARGVPTLVAFFGETLARQQVAIGGQADLIIGNNVLAQVPDLNDFVAGIKILLKPQGVVTLEFPHLLTLLRENQFDTIYHEHFSYFSMLTAERIFAAHGLTLFDVEELWSHGGSLRLYLRHSEAQSPTIRPSVGALRQREQEAGLDQLACYAGFAEQVRETKRKLLDFLIQARRAGKQIAGYGAPGKGNTLLNYCGIRQDLLDYTVDRNPYKHGRFTPGTRIPIYPVEKLRDTQPDYVLILPWNVKDEIIEQHSYIRDWGGRFVVPIPEVKIL